MISFLVLNIISSVSTLCLVVPEFIEIIHARYENKRPEYILSVVLHYLMFIIGLVQAVTSIVAARYSCLAVCGQNQNYSTTIMFADDPTTKNESNLVPLVLNVETANTYE